MLKVLVNIYPWEGPKLFLCNFDVKKGDKVIVPAEDGNEIGIVLKENMETSEKPQNKIIRAATAHDVEIYDRYEKEKESILEVCRKEVKSTQLPMKVIDVRITLDGKQIIFVFTSDGRVDFRELVRVLSRQFKKNIRMQQIGSRDEARKLGGFGICGRKLCCVSFAGSISSITTDMARAQQIAHRGAERISGLCGRLMCCLAYEAQEYKKLLIGMPELYSVVKTKEGKGTVIEINVMNQEVKVKLESGQYVSVKKEEIK